MLLRLIFMLAWLALVAACSEQLGQSAPEAAPPPVAAAPEPDPAPPVFVQPERVSVTEGQAAIDWTAARTDLASSGGNVLPQGFQIQSGEQAPPVPVLLPTGLVQPAGADMQPRFRPLPDGYFARYPGTDYDITISGTNEVFGDGTASPAAAATDAVFQSMATGALVTLRRYGASYMVEFECKGVPGAAGVSCIDEAEALEIANSLVIAGTR